MTAYEHVMNGIDLARIDPGLMQPRVTARCSTDDCCAEVPEFDASPWFALATLDEILALWEEDFGGGETADCVAELAEWYDPRVEQMFAYKRISGQGFECHVDPDAAQAWLQIHLREVLSRPGSQMTLGGFETARSEAQESWTSFPPRPQGLHRERSALRGRRGHPDGGGVGERRAPGGPCAGYHQRR